MNLNDKKKEFKKIRSSVASFRYEVYQYHSFTVTFVYDKDTGEFMSIMVKDKYLRMNVRIIPSGEGFVDFSQNSIINITQFDEITELMQDVRDISDIVKDMRKNKEA